ncbi:hypothetical protein FACS1894184_01380 [Clostridia bacterium]|nr:hypothetical protein FACS1894184_01380 [Clostridia bacterium]
MSANRNRFLSNRNLINRFRDVMHERGLTAILAAMLSFGLSLTMCDTLTIPTDPWFMALLCAGCASLALLFAMHWSLRAIGWTAIAAALTAIIIQSRPIPWLINAISDAAIGSMSTINERPVDIMIILTVGLSLFNLLANRHREGFYPSLSLACVIALWSWVSGGGENPWSFAPVLFALVALFARSRCEQTGPARVVSMAALAVVAALVLLPSGHILNDQLATLAEKVRRVAYDYLFYNEPRTIYSIQYDGFQPLGSQLGGSVENPSERDVMRVETPRTLLLRGVSKDTYTGISWMDQALSSRRYLYVDPRWRSIRDNLLDADRPLVRLRDPAMFEPIEATVTMLGESMTTLFVPHRLTALSTPMDMVLYFNSTGEVFATRNLTAGDSYTLRAHALSIDDSRLPELAQDAAQSGVQDWDTVVLDAYRTLPQTISPQVYQIVNDITADQSTQLGKLLAIRDYLKQFTYTLTPSRNPPANTDFVSFFLLEGHEGYCTYFASAMAVMARIAGLPARYIEGYVAQPDSNGVALVTGMNAHAWVEVYLTGLGWISVDATPGLPPNGITNPSPDNPDDIPPENNEGDTPSDTDSPNPTAEPNQPTSDPSDPTLTPNPSQPTPTPEPPLDLDPDSTKPPNAVSSPDPETHVNDQPEKRSSWWLWLLIVLAALGTAARAVWVMPTMAARRRKGEDEQLLIWYRAALALLAACGTPALPSDTPLTLSRHAASLAPLFEAVAALAYKSRTPDAQTIIVVALAYKTTFNKTPIRVKLTVWLGRFLHGAGAVRQVP